MFEAVLFDHDGTLVDSERAHWQIWNQVLDEFGVSFDFDFFAQYCIGVPVDNTTRFLIEHFGLPIAAVDLFARKEKAALEFQAEQGFAAIDGAIELLNELHAGGVKIAVVSGACRASVLASATQHGFDHKAEIMVTGCDVKNNKPHPEGYLTALRALGVAPQNAIALEDSPSGVASAKAAGLECFALHHNFIARDKLAAADGIFNSYTQIRTALLARLRPLNC